MVEFSASGTPLTRNDVDEVLDLIGAEESALWAVLAVETSGSGFLPDRRSKILFERHYFHRLTEGRFDDEYPEISAKSAGGYGAAGAHQYDRLNIALKLDEAAALQSASWGLGQIMGSHFAKLGYATPVEMVETFARSEGEQLTAIAKFLIAEGLVDVIREKNWAHFARVYNGPNYAINRYDEKLASYYERYKTGSLPDLTLRAAQLMLVYDGFKIAVDGAFGPATSDALSDYQRKNNLPVTGKLDDKTSKALFA